MAGIAGGQRADRPADPGPPERAAHLAALARINVEDMLGALGLAHVRRGRWLMEMLCWQPARRFALEVLSFDDLVGAGGLVAASSWLLERYPVRLRVTGLAGFPLDGPLLVVSNHPGLCDTIALFASIPRPDLRVVAADRPFLRALPNTSRRVLFIHESPARRLALIRAIAGHLRDGGSALTFPGGEIEPDPALRSGAAAGLARWSSSLDLLVRLAPDLTIVPAIVGGVLSPGAQGHPLTLIRRRQKDREWLGAMLQVMSPQHWPVAPRVAFGPPVRVADFTGSASRADERRVGSSMIGVAIAAIVRAEVLAAARGLLEEYSDRRSPLPRGGDRLGHRRAPPGDGSLREE